MVELPIDLARLRELGVELSSALRRVQIWLQPNMAAALQQQPLDWRHEGCRAMELLPEFADAVRPILAELKRPGSGIVSVGVFARPTAHEVLQEYASDIVRTLNDPSPNDADEIWQMRGTMLAGRTRDGRWPDIAGWNSLVAAMDDEVREAARRRKPPKRTGKRGGQRKYDPAATKKIVSAWKTGRYKTKKDLAAELNEPVKVVLRAIDRARK